jgi:hypothetical protein
LWLSFPWENLLGKTPNDICMVKEEESCFCWEMSNGFQLPIYLPAIWIFCGFDVHYASFSVWNFAFLMNVWAFYFCSMWILTTTAFHYPKVHFHGCIADIGPLCTFRKTNFDLEIKFTRPTSASYIFLSRQIVTTAVK